jgi:hypothetical protein
MKPGIDLVLRALRLEHRRAIERCDAAVCHEHAVMFEHALAVEDSHIANRQIGRGSLLRRQWRWIATRGEQKDGEASHGHEM